MANAAAKQHPLFTRAVGLHQQGRLPEARAAYQQLLQQRPDHADGWHLSGILALQSGDYPEAITQLDRALTLRPEQVDSLLACGTAHHALGQHEAAVQRFEQFEQQGGSNVRAVVYRSLSLLKLGRRQAALPGCELALEAFAAALQRDPDNIELLSLQANVLHELGRTEQALASYERLLPLQPERAQLWTLRGIALEQLRRHDESLTSHERALALDPANADAHCNLGVLLEAMGQPGRARQAYERSLQLNPHNVIACANLGTRLNALGHVDEAIEHYQRAIALRPDYAPAHSHLGAALHSRNELDAALACFDRALQLSPEHAEARWNKSLTLLLAGDFSGWQHYEARWQNPAFPHTQRRFAQALWLGQEPVQGRTVLLHAEQGLGDTLQFCRYAPLLAHLGATVILQVQRPLVALLRSLPGVAQVIAEGDALPHFDLHCPLMSLPLAFGTTLQTVPSAECYLAADPALVQAWSTRLGDKRGLRIGLAWSGNAVNPYERSRSLPLAQWLPHLPEGNQYFCLQRDVRDDDAKTLAATPGIAYYGDLLNFEHTAALCTLLDLVISIDTSITHLAGALGVPAWLLLPQHPDHRWLLGREDSPWYPGLTLVRQPLAGDWDSVLQQVGAALRGN